MADSNGGRIVTPPTPMKITQIAVVVRDMEQAETFTDPRLGPWSVFDYKPRCCMTRGEGRARGVPHDRRRGHGRRLGFELIQPVSGPSTATSSSWIPTARAFSNRCMTFQQKLLLRSTAANGAEEVMRGGSATRSSLLPGHRADARVVLGSAAGTRSTSSRDPSPSTRPYGAGPGGRRGRIMTPVRGATCSDRRRTGSCRALLSPRGRAGGGVPPGVDPPPAAGVPAGRLRCQGQLAGDLGLCPRRAAPGGRDGTDVAAVAATSMREGIVLYDADGAEIWACRRGQPGGCEAEELIAEGAAERSSPRPATGSRSRRRPGCAGRPGTGRLFGRIHSLGMLSDWIVYRLAGGR